MELLKDNLDSINKYDVLVFTRLVRGRVQIAVRRDFLHAGETLHYVVSNSYQGFVHRITLTTANGHEFELPWMQVKARCKQIGVEHVPELHRQRHYCGDGEMLLQLVEPMVEGGMVVRVESGLETRFFKHFRDENAPIAPQAGSRAEFMNPCIGTSWGMV